MKTFTKNKAVDYSPRRLHENYYYLVLRLDLRKYQTDRDRSCHQYEYEYVGGGSQNQGDWSECPSFPSTDDFMANSEDLSLEGSLTERDSRELDSESKQQKDNN